MGPGVLCSMSDSGTEHRPQRRALAGCLLYAAAGVLLLLAGNSFIDALDQSRALADGRPYTVLDYDERGNVIGSHEQTVSSDSVRAARVEALILAVAGVLSLGVAFALKGVPWRGLITPRDDEEAPG